VSYANEAVLPFYILRKVVPLLVGYDLVLRWNLSVFLQYVLMLAISFAHHAHLRSTCSANRCLVIPVRDERGGSGPS
jgi:hypothetical protein